MSAPAISSSFPSPPVRMSAADHSPIADAKLLESILKAAPKSSSSATPLFQCLKPQWQPALQQVAYAVSMLAFSLYLLSPTSESSPIASFSAPFSSLSAFLCTATALMVNSFAFSFIYLIISDCCFNIFTPSSKVNYSIGYLFSILFFNSFAYFSERRKSGGAGEASASSAAAEPKKPVVADDDLYDDSIPIYSSLLIAIRDRQNWKPSQLLFLSVLLPTAIYMLSISKLFFLCYWAMPYLLFPFFFNSISKIFTNNIENFLSFNLSCDIPNYHLLAVSNAIINWQKLGAAALSSNLHIGAAPSSSSFFSEWRNYFVNLWPRLNWVSITFVVIFPIFGVIGTRFHALTTPTLIFSIIYYIFSGLGITAGYHRLFAHRAYEAGRAVTIMMMVMGTASLQGSIKWWCNGHRLHHRYTDTSLDPYNAKKGFMWAHLGWMLVKPSDRDATATPIKADLSDLLSKPIIVWQHKNYLWFGPFMAYVFPSVIASLWGDALGGLIYAGVLRLMFVHHATFCVNSVAHWFGDFTYDDRRTPRDHFVTALITFGEGYHNFHHEFPNDYRNGILFYHYDPTKWLIKGLNYLGLVQRLKVFSENEINMGKVFMMEKSIANLKKNITYPPDVTSLPLMSWREVREQCEKHKRKLVVIDNMVHDIESFIPRHPGGRFYIESAVGTDASQRFHGGGKYQHSEAANRLLATFRIGRLAPETKEQ